MPPYIAIPTHYFADAQRIGIESDTAANFRLGHYLYALLNLLLEPDDSTGYVPAGAIERIMAPSK
jgi:hypothetical protein